MSKLLISLILVLMSTTSFALSPEQAEMKLDFYIARVEHVQQTTTNEAVATRCDVIKGKLTKLKQFVQNATESQIDEFINKYRYEISRMIKEIRELEK